MQITADLLLNYQRCHRRAFLDTYGDPSQRDPMNDYVLKLVQDSRENHRLVLAERSVHKPKFPSSDWQVGAAETVKLMQQGAEFIYQGVLMSEEEGVTLVSNPDLLIKEPGQSLFGDWLYVPTEIKLGKRPKTEYQIIAAYHTYVLAQVQGAWAETAWLILREKGEYAVDLWEMLPRMQAILTDCIHSMQHQQEPDVFISRSRCSLCHWLGHCHTIAQGQNHLSLLPGVTAARYLQLEALNLTSIKALAETHPNQLEHLPGFGPETARKLIRQARSTLHDRAILIEENFPVTTSPWAILNNAQVPTAPIELYFDIEAEPSLDLAYLHGILVVNQVTNSQEYYPLLAESPNEEFQVWQQFLNLVNRYPNAPIFHFCPYEVQTVERLANHYGTSGYDITVLMPRFIDLHERVTRSVILPIESYALKQIARWLGFEWQDPSANGPQSICWYSQWIETGDRAYLNSILTYNEDDCRATYHVKQWLVQFLQSRYQAELA